MTKKLSKNHATQKNKKVSHRPRISYSTNNIQKKKDKIRKHANKKNNYTTISVHVTLEKMSYCHMASKKHDHQQKEPFQSLSSDPR